MHIYLGDQKIHLVFFCKKKTHFFILTNNYWFGYFSMLAISHMLWHWLFSVNVLTWLLSTSSGLPYRGAMSSEKSSVRNFTNHFWHVLSVTEPSPHTAQFFFACQLHFYLSWNNKVSYAKKVAYFLSSSVLKWLHKNSPILISFFKCMLTWQLSQYNLTNLFQMKLKTTKCY